jgi:hypothetical protein
LRQPLANRRFAPKAGKARPVPANADLKSEDLPKHDGVHSGSAERSRSERNRTGRGLPEGVFVAHDALCFA